MPGDDLILPHVPYLNGYLILALIEKSAISELILNMKASMDTEIPHKNPLKNHPGSSEEFTISSPGDSSLFL